MYVFKCHSNSNRFGFTRDRNGENLPCGDVCSGWDCVTQVDFPKVLFGGVNRMAAMAAVEVQGFYVCDTGVSVSISETPPPIG
jgi:hypothetical protein